MGAGKSLDLLKTAYNYEEREKEIVLLTSSLDDRYGKNKITSRLGGLNRDAIPFTKETNIFSVSWGMCPHSGTTIVRYFPPSATIISSV